MSQYDGYEQPTIYTPRSALSRPLSRSMYLPPDESKSELSQSPYGGQNGVYKDKAGHKDDKGECLGGICVA